MIARFIKNDQTLERWTYLKSRKVVILSFWGIVLSCFFSFTAEFWANSKPLYLSYKGNSYFPIFNDYAAKDFGIEDAVTVDYRSLELDGSDSIIWPVIKWDPYESNKGVDEYPAPPSGSNIMGTDDRGRDVFARLLYGFRYSFLYAVGVWLLSYIVGVILGGLQGYLGGRTDMIGQRLTEIWESIPGFFLLIIIISAFQPTLALLIVFTVFFGWMGIAQYMRAEFLRNKNLDYVEAARAIGANHFKIFFKHIFPNSLTPIITFSPFVIAGGIMGLAGLDYLGFGLTPPTPSWGELMAQAQENFTTAWWLAFWPFVAMFSLLLSLALIGAGVRDMMDPRRLK
jgi:microcin C transport system permease protein